MSSRYSGLATLAAVAVYAWSWLVPGTELATEALLRIAPAERRNASELDQLMRSWPLEPQGPNLLDGFVPAGKAGL